MLQFKLLISIDYTDYTNNTQTTHIFNFIQFYYVYTVRFEISRLREGGGHGGGTMSGRWRRSKRPMAQADAHAHIPPLLPLTTSRKGLSNAISCWYCDCKITSFNELIFQFGRRHARFLFQFQSSVVVLLSVEHFISTLFFFFPVCSAVSSSFFLLD